MTKTYIVSQTRTWNIEAENSDDAFEQWDPESEPDETDIEVQPEDGEDEENT